MITRIEATSTVSDRVFSDALEIIERSGAAGLLDSYAAGARKPGGRPPTGVRYTITAVLVATLIRIMLTRTPSISGVLESIADFTPAQLAATGMPGADPVAMRDDYPRFSAWLDQRLSHIDPGFDLPARRVTNAEHKAALAARSEEDKARSELALERSRAVMNRLVAGSILDPDPVGCRGDLVADESIIDLAGPSAGLGSRDDKRRGAAYLGRYYARDRKTSAVLNPAGGKSFGKSGFGIGVTTVTRIGKPDAIHAVAPVFTGVDVHHPTPGSAEALGHAIRFHRANGFDNRLGGRARWPLLTVDMGYNVRPIFARLMLDQQYSPVARYPQNWTTTFLARNPPGSTKTAQPGVVQGFGALYCEAAVPLLVTRKLIHPNKSLLASKEFRAHDEHLAALFPFLVGTNSTLKLARANPGRPRSGDNPVELAVKAEVVCPAVQGRCRCPLKPQSMDLAPPDAPTAAPTWSAHERTLCHKSSTTITLTPDQLRMAQWAYVPGSWEHALYFEAARSLTERQFSYLKSKHITGISELTWAPRREPMIKIIVALMLATANYRFQRGHLDKPEKTESIREHWRQLTRDLGHPPTRVPPRT